MKSMSIGSDYLELEPFKIYNFRCLWFSLVLIDARLVIFVFSNLDFIHVLEDMTLKYYDESRTLAIYILHSKLSYTLAEENGSC